MSSVGGRRQLNIAPLVALFFGLLACFAVLYRESSALQPFGYQNNHASLQNQPCMIRNAVAGRSSSQQRVAAPVHVNSSWIGNQWIPGPGYKLYSGGEMQDLFRNYSVLFMGDSTARRTYATLYGILNTTRTPSDVHVKTIDHPSVIDVNKVVKTERCQGTKKNKGFWLCRTNPQDSTKSVDLMGWSCLKELAVGNASMFFRNQVHNYNLVLFMAGPWELMVRCGTRGDEWEIYMDTILNNLMELEALYPNITFVWRTWGYQNVANPNRVPNLLKRIGKYNNYVMERLDQHDREMLEKISRPSRVTYVDWASVMEPRMGPDTRIRGDIDPHFGLEARLAFLQMLVNHLAVRNEQLQEETSCHVE